MACECSAKKQTAEHVIASCPIYHHSNGARVFSELELGPLADRRLFGYFVDCLLKLNIFILQRRGTTLLGSMARYHLMMVTIRKKFLFLCG